MLESHIGNQVVKASTRTTWEPSFEKINAYSTPTMPAPCTTSLFGMPSMLPIVSESKTPGKLKSTGGNLLALEPVAMMMASVFSCFSAPSTPLNSTVCSSIRLPYPCKILTWKVADNRAARYSALCVALDMRSLTSPHVLAPSITPSRRHLECAPVGAPLMTPLGSMRTTFFPRAPASAAACSPAGPAPRTTASWVCAWA
mmetsp:Transcript_94883/g.283336  ORF Transcript_94883/g.283336 Transcript_94883/m.283336 type:complete len:200 (-) Transcript_94883:480-1079(-)